MSTKLFIITFFFFIGANVFANDEKSKNLHCQTHIDGSSVPKSLEDYETLPDFQLDLSDVQKSISELIEDVEKLSEDYQKLKGLESATPTSLDDLKTLSLEVDNLKEKIQNDAVLAINQLTPAVASERKTLEGHRILNDRISSLSEKYSSRIEHAEDLSNNEQNDLPENSIEQESNDTTVSNADNYLDNVLRKKMAELLKDRKNSEISTDNMESNFSETTDSPNNFERNQNSSDQKSSESSPKQQGSETESSTSKPGDLLSQLFNETQKEWNKANPSEENQSGDSQSSEGQPSEGQPGDSQSSEGQPGEGQPGDSQSSEGQPSEGQPRDSQSSEGQPGEGQPGDSQSSEGQPGEGQPGDSQSGENGTGEKGGELIEGQTATTQGGDADENGNDGLQEGGGHLGQTLRDALEKILEKKAKTSSGKSKDPLNDNSDIDLKEKDYSKLDLESLKNEPNASDGKPWEEVTGNQDTIDSREVEEMPRTDIDELNQEQISQLIKLFIELAWVETLGNYSNSVQYKKSLTEFMALSNELFVKFPAIDLLQQYAQKAANFIEELSVLEIEYNDLEDLGLSVIKTNEQQEIGLLRKLKYIDRVFTELDNVRDLEMAEQRLLGFVRKVLGGYELNNNPSDKELGEAFYNLMQGPLSRSALGRDFSSENPKESLDWKSTAESIREGKLNDLVLFSRMAPFVDILVNEVYKPHYQPKSMGDNEPINEYDSVIDGANNFEELPDVIKEGFPAELEILRMLSGDSLKNAYKEPIDISNPKKPLSNKVTIVLYDISGSMRSNKKEVARNAIVTSLVDKSQLEVSRGEGTHTLYMIPFDARPHEPERVGDIAQAQSYFDRMRAQPLGSGGDDSISEGMIKAFELIADHQKNGGELERGNILLITDAVAPIDFEGVQAARDKIDSEIDIALNAVTIGDWNKDVSKMIERYAINSDGNMGKVSHQHIPYEDLARYLDVQLYLRSLEESASTFNERKTDSLPNKVLVSFKDALIRVKTEKERGAQKSSSTTKNLVKRLSSPNFSESGKGIESALKLFYRFAMSSISDTWSQNIKAETFINFIDILVDVYSTNSDLIYSSIGEKDRIRIIKWLDE